MRPGTVPEVSWKKRSGQTRRVNINSIWIDLRAEKAPLSKTAVEVEELQKPPP